MNCGCFITIFSQFPWGNGGGKMYLILEIRMEIWFQINGKIEPKKSFTAELSYILTKSKVTCKKNFLHRRFRHWPVNIAITTFWRKKFFWCQPYFNPYSSQCQPQLNPSQTLPKPYSNPKLTIWYSLYSIIDNNELAKNYYWFRLLNLNRR